MAATVRTLADFVTACDDFDEVQELVELSPDEMQAVLEEYPALLKDAGKTAGRKQREKLMSEHKEMQGGAQEAQPEANGAQEAQLEVTCPVLRSSVCYLYMYLRSRSVNVFACVHACACTCASHHCQTLGHAFAPNHRGNLRATTPSTK